MQKTSKKTNNTSQSTILSIPLFCTLGKPFIFLFVPDNILDFKSQPWWCLKLIMDRYWNECVNKGKSTLTCVFNLLIKGFLFKEMTFYTNNLPYFRLTEVVLICLLLLHTHLKLLLMIRCMLHTPDHKMVDTLLEVPERQACFITICWPILGALTRIFKRIYNLFSI